MPFLTYVAKQPNATLSKVETLFICCILRSISNGPDYINDRSEFGYWEIDTGKAVQTQRWRGYITKSSATKEFIPKPMLNVDSS